MSNFYEITHKHIESLDQVQLVELMNKLIYLEADKYGIPAYNANTTMNILAADGGEDASIEWSNGLEETDYFPCKICMFQAKATDITKAKCKKEMINQSTNDISQDIDTLFKKDGCYILINNKDLTNKMKKDRIKGFRESLSDKNKIYAESAKIRVYGSNEIAQWVMGYISATALVLQMNGISSDIYFQTWEEWSRQGKNSFDYCKDEDVEKKIESIRGKFYEKHQVLRVLGLSGMGKTRFIMETLRLDTTDLRQRILSEKVIYAKANQFNGPGGIINELYKIRSRGLDCVIVIDDCPLEDHKAIMNVFNHQDCKFSVITIDYALEDSRDCERIILEPASDAIIRSIITQTYAGMSDEDISRVVEFAEGFPLMAVLIAEARIKDSRQIGRLDDTTLVKRLLWKRDVKDDIKESVIKACALFDYVGVEDSVKDQMVYLAENVCKISTNDFYNAVTYFIKNGILDQRGRVVSVRPKPLALTLAGIWWDENHVDFIKEIIIDNLPDNMVEPLCKQITKLDTSDKAKALTKSLCGEQGPFGHAEELNTKRGSRIFRALVEVDPIETSKCLSKAFGNMMIGEAQNFVAGRRDIVWSLEMLCYREDTFHEVIRVLALLAAAEVERWSNNSVGLFNQIFHVIMAGTQVSLEERFLILKEISEYKETEYKSLVIDAIAHALEAGGYTKTLGAETQGTRLPLEDYRPTNNEVHLYWEKCLHLLVKISETDTGTIDKVKKVVEASTRGLIHIGEIDLLEDAFFAIGKRCDWHWPELVHSIRQYKKYAKEDQMDADLEKKIDRLLERFSPKSLRDKVEMIVSIPDWVHEKQEDGQYKDISEVKAIEFAREVSESMDQLVENIQFIYTGEQRKGYVFGKELGRLVADPLSFINLSFTALENSSNPNVRVLCGFIDGVGEDGIKNYTLDKIYSSQKLVELLPLASSLIDIRDDDIERLIEALDKNVISANNMRALAYSKIHNNVGTRSLLKLVQKMMSYGAEAKLVGLEILFTHVNEDDERFNAASEIISDICIDFDVMNHLEDFSNMDSYYWMESVKKLLHYEKIANTILSNIIKVSKENKQAYRNNDEYIRILHEIIKQEKFKALEIFLDSLHTATDFYERNNLRSLAYGRYGSSREASLLDELNHDLVFKWIKKNSPEGVKTIIPIIPTVSNHDNKNSFHPVIKRIIEDYPTLDNLASIANHMGPTSWSGSIIPYYKGQIDVLSMYVNHKNSVVRKWARERIGWLKENIERESIIEAEQSRGIYPDYF